MMHSLKLYKTSEDSSEVIEIDPTSAASAAFQLKSTYSYDDYSNSLVTFDLSGSSLLGPNE